MGKVNLEMIHEEIMEARKVAWEAYAKAQANNEVHAWIVLNGGCAERRIESGVWSITGYLYKDHILPPGMAWERKKDGSKELVRHDLETGEKGIVISYDVKDEERLDLFEAEVDLSTRVVTVKRSIAAEHLRPEDFWLNYDNFDLATAWRFDRSWEQNRLGLVRGKL